MFEDEFIHTREESETTEESEHEVDLDALESARLRMPTKTFGFAVHFFEDGSRYKGEWENGMPHGDGHMDYDNGDVYKGEFEDGLKHGKGTYIYTDGRKYVGHWERD